MVVWKCSLVVFSVKGMNDKLLLFSSFTDSKHLYIPLILWGVYVLLLPCICPPTQEWHDPAFLVDTAVDWFSFIHIHTLALLFPPSPSLGTRDTPRSLGSDSLLGLPARSSLMTSQRMSVWWVEDSQARPQRCVDFWGISCSSTVFCRQGDPTKEQSKPLFLAGPRLGLACQSQC